METNEFEEFKQAIATEFSGMTIKEVLRLAELGKDALSVSDDLAEDLMFVTERVLKSDETLVHEIQFCLSSLPALVRCVREYERAIK